MPRAESPAASRNVAVIPKRLRRYRVSEDIRALMPLMMAIVGISIYAISTSEQFLTVSNIQNVFKQIAVLGILSVGMMLLMIAGQLDLSVGAAVSFISVVAAKMLGSHVSETWVAVVLIVMGAAIGLIYGLVVVITRVQPFILTLGGLSVLSALALIVSDVRVIPTGLSYASLSIKELGIVPVPAVIFVGVCVLAALFLRFTRLGRNAYAIGSNEEAAYLAGIPVGFTKVTLFVINGVLVGAAALMMLARVGAGDPNGGTGLELQAVTAAVLGGAALSGGRGTILGIFLSVFFLGIVSNALTLAGVPTSWTRLVFGGVLIIAVVWGSLRDQRRRKNASLRQRLMAFVGRMRPQ